MTKLEFIKELESLLPDIPLEERDEALRYYNGYFEDAGEDHEDEIMKELGSPKRVASIIKADLNSNAADRESRGYFTENGYQDTIYNDEKYEIVGAAKSESDHANQTNNADQTKNTNNANNTNYTNAGWKPGQNSNQSTGSGTNQSKQQKASTKNNNAGLIIILILFSPIWFPLLMSVFGVFIGVVAAILGLIFGLGAAGIAMMAAGIALFIAGLIQLSVPFFGLLFCGCGLIILGLGMLFVLFTGFLCKTVLPALIKGVVNLCRLPFQNRSVTA
jgi:uncharacterized membrane protein